MRDMRFEKEDAGCWITEFRDLGIKELRN